MQGGEGPLTGAVMEDALEELETLIGVAESVAVGEEEDLAVVSVVSGFLCRMTPHSFSRYS